jgi:hypothetical protein
MAHSFGGLVSSEDQSDRESIGSMEGVIFNVNIILFIQLPLTLMIRMLERYQ